MPSASAVTLVIFAAAVGCNRSTPEAKAATAPTPAPTAAPAPASGQATAVAGGEPAQEAPPGVDLKSLDDFEKKVFFRVTNREPSACGKAHSLLQSLKVDPQCRKSLYAVRYVARLVDNGLTDSEVSEAIQKRFRAARKSVDVSEAPMKGNSAARITVVEFIDYECPACKRVQPVLRQALDEFKNEVRVYLKHYPLGMHTNARLAAEAAVAANLQGKFWPYNDKLWASSDSLTPARLESIAKEIGLDVEKWRKDLESEAVKNRVKKDQADGTALSISGTPAIYLNGREFTDNRDIDSLRDWIQEELGK
jgi:protein-disulfide isomerase